MSDKKDEVKEPAAAELTPDPDEKPAWEGSRSSSVPIVMPDGHVILSQEDIDNAKNK